MSTVPSTDPAAAELSLAVVNLMKGAVYQDTHERAWQSVLAQRHALSQYVSVIGLEAVIDESEGYAFLRSVRGDDEPDMPRLVARRTLPFHTSVLLALLRKRLAEFDATSSEARLVLTRDQLVEMLRLYLPDSTNEAKVIDSIDIHIARVVDLGFLRKLHGQEHTFEVRRIIKAFVDGQWLADFDRRLDEYLALLAGTETTRADTQTARTGTEAPPTDADAALETATAVPTPPTEEDHGT